MLDKQINYTIILPDNIRVVSSLSFSSCPKDCIFKPGERANNVRSTIERVLFAIAENVVVLVCMLDIKKMVNYSI